MPTFTVTLRIAELTLSCDLFYSPGSPDVPPAYSHGGIPGDPPESYCTGCRIVEYDSGTQVDIDIFPFLTESGFLDLENSFDQKVLAAAESQISAYYDQPEPPPAAPWDDDDIPF